MGRRTRRVSASLLAAVSPGWEDRTATVEVDDYTYDPRNPQVFYVDPPNDGTGAVRAVYAAYPVALETLTELTDDVEAWGAQELPVSDAYIDALVNFVLHRAYLKEAEWALDPARARSHLELYLELIGVKAAQDVEFSNAGD